MKRFLLFLLSLFVISLSAACGAATESAAAEDSYDIKSQGSAQDITGGTPDGNGLYEGKAAPGEDEGDMVPATVTRVIDGDTIEVLIGEETAKVRLIGVDTPESVHPDAERNIPYGEISSAFTKETLLDKEIGMEFDVEEYDRYGRLLAYVYIEGEMFNKTLLNEGHAMIATYPPNVKYVDLFTETQKAAREAGKGVWALESAKAADRDAAYIGTTGSYKFHTRSCAWGEKITEANAAYFDTRDEAIAAGFVPCKVCAP